MMETSLRVYTCYQGPARDEAETDQEYAVRCESSWATSEWRADSEQDAIGLLCEIARRVTDMTGGYSVIAAAVHAVETCGEAFINTELTQEEAEAITRLIEACGESPDLFRETHTASPPPPVSAASSIREIKESDHHA